MMTSKDMELFAKFTEPLIGLEASHVWMGYGSAIFVEFGELHIKVRLNGKIGHNPVGNMTLFACEGWRLEGKRRIWCGSWTDKERWPRFLKSMQGAKVASIALVGRLGEIDLCLSNGLHLVTFMTNQGDPDWSLRNREDVHMQIVVGKLHFDLRNMTRNGM
jgi:hypothetical protein